MISTIGFIVFGALLAYEFIAYWLGILGTYLSATKSIQEDGLRGVIGKAEDIWVRFWTRSLVPILMICFCFYLRNIGL